MTTAAHTTDARRARIAEIQAAALTRQALGQAATYHRLDDGQHQVTIRGLSATGTTLAEAVAQARGQRP